MVTFIIYYCFVFLKLVQNWYTCIWESLFIVYSSIFCVISVYTLKVLFHMDGFFLKPYSSKSPRMKMTLYWWKRLCLDFCTNDFKSFATVGCFTFKLFLMWSALLNDNRISDGQQVLFSSWFVPENWSGLNETCSCCNN